MSPATVTPDTQPTGRQRRAAAGALGDAAGRWPGPDDLVDGAVVMVLSAIALLGLQSVFDGVGAMVLGLYAALVGVLVAWALAARRASALVALVALVGAFVAASGPAVADDAVAGVVPNPSALWHGLVHAWPDLVTTAPPVGLGRGLGVVPFTCGFLGAALAVTVARRTRATLAPAAPLAASLATGFALGTREPVSTLVQGGLLALVALGWAAVRANRDRRATDGATYWPRIWSGLGMLAAVLAVGMLVGPGLPFADARPRVVLREQVIPPFEPRDYPSPLAAFRSYKTAGKEDVYFTVEGLAEGTRIRLATMDRYDGVVWVVSGAEASGSGRFERVGSRILPVPPGRAATVDVRVGAYEGVWVPTMGATRSVGFRGSGADDLAAAFRYNRATGTGASPVFLAEGDRYRLDVSLPPAPGTLEGRQADGRVVLPGLPTDPAVREALQPVQDRAVELAGGAPSGYAQAKALADALSKGAYADGGPGAPQVERVAAGHSVARLRAFLDADQLVGNGEQYAAAMALMARELGLPARVVIGFRPKGEGRVQVKGSDVAAWVEVKLEGVGWVPFDPTPPEENKPRPQEQAKRLEQELAQQEPPPEEYLEPPEDPAELARRNNRKQRRSVPDTAASGFAIPRPLVLAALYGGTPTAVVAGLGLAVVGAKGLRRRRRRTRGSVVQRAAGAWREVADRLVDQGLRPTPGSTRRELALTAGPERWPSGVPYAARVDGVMFGPGHPVESDVAELWSGLPDELGALARPLTRRQRLRAAVSVASFRPGTRRADRSRTTER